MRAKGSASFAVRSRSPVGQKGVYTFEHASDLTVSANLYPELVFFIELAMAWS